MPGLQRPFQLRRVGRIAGRAGHGVEPPLHPAALSVIGRDIAAAGIFRAGVADDHHALHHAGDLGDRVGLLEVGGLHRPGDLAGPPVERDQPPVEGAQVDPALPGRDPAVDHVAAGDLAGGAVDLGIVLPKLLAGGRVIGLHHAPGRGDVEHAVDDHRGGFLAALGVDVAVPGEAEPGDVGLVDAGERAVALLRIGPPGGHPRPGLAVGAELAGRVHRGGAEGMRRRLGGGDGGRGEDRRQRKGRPKQPQPTDRVVFHCLCLLPCALFHLRPRRTQAGRCISLLRHPPLARRGDPGDPSGLATSPNSAWVPRISLRLTGG